MCRAGTHHQPPPPGQAVGTDSLGTEVISRQASIVNLQYDAGIVDCGRQDLGVTVSSMSKHPPQGPQKAMLHPACMWPLTGRVMSVPVASEHPTVVSGVAKPPPKCFQSNGTRHCDMD